MPGTTLSVKKRAGGGGLRQEGCHGWPIYWPRRKAKEKKGVTIAAERRRSTWELECVEEVGANRGKKANPVDTGGSTSNPRTGTSFEDLAQRREGNNRMIPVLPDIALAKIQFNKADRAGQSERNSKIRDM